MTIRHNPSRIEGGIYMTGRTKSPESKPISRLPGPPRTHRGNEFDCSESAYGPDLGMPDHRRVPRTQVRAVAKVIAGQPPRSYPCFIRDISSLGARIEFPNATIIPNVFELTFDSGRTLRSCHVTWRTATQLGVEFSNPQAA
jgi:PilZ domain